MTVKVFVEQVDGHTFRASTLSPVLLASEGESKEQAIESLQGLVQERLRDGELIDVEVPGTGDGHPWMPFAGMWRDNPHIDNYASNIEEYRRAVDQEGRPGIEKPGRWSPGTPAISEPLRA